MSEIVNLRQARKRAERAAKETEAAVNHARFGQSKADRKLAEAEKDKQRKTMDAARRDDPGK